MKNVINVEEMKRYLKRSLKKKVKITTSLIVLFMMSNSIVSGQVIVIDKGKIGSGSAGAAGKKWGNIEKEPPKGAVALNISSTDENRVAHENVGGYSVAVGYGANAKADESVAIGRGSEATSRESVSIGLQSKIKGDQGVSIGAKSAAEKQSVAIGGDTYALGESSIAIGNDDIGGTDHLPVETIKRIYKGIVDKGIKTQEEFNGSYIDSTQYSPTYAGGKSAIAIGSRSVAAADQAIAMGVLSFALANGSTAIGRYAFVDENADQGLAVGEQARVFSAHSLALGNENESTSKGSMSYGYKAKAVGEGSLAIGNKVASNAEIKNISKLREIFNGNSGIDTKKNSIEKYDPEYVETSNTKFTLSGKDVKPLKSEGEYGLTLGSNAYSIGNNSMTIGSLSLSEGKNSLALGVISYAKGDNSMAIGTESISKANNSMAIGIGAKADLENSLALGNKSMTDYQPDWFNKKGYVPKGAISLPSSTNVGVISVGSIGQERRITNVAAGYRDTDAVNVSQLKSVEDKLSAVNLSSYDSSMVNFVSVDKTTANGEGKKMQDLAIRMENYKEYIQLKSKLLEMKVRKEKNHETINGEVEKEIENILKDEKYKYIKNKDKSFKEFETQVTNKIKANGKATDILKEIDKKKDELIEDKNLKSILSTEEKKSFEKSNFYNKSTTGKDAVAIGVFADATKEQAIAIGKNTKGDSFSVAIGGNSESGNTAVAIGDRAKALSVKSVAIGHNAKANQDESVAIGNNSEAQSSTDKAYLTDDTNNGGRTFAVGGTSLKRRITGVADGSADSDAVTVAQLKKLSEKGITFKDDKDTETTVSLAEKIKISGKEDSTNDKYRNISVTTNNKNLEVALSKTLKGITSIENGKDSAKLTLNSDNIAVNNKRITGLSDGTAGSDAVTFNQLEARTKFTIQADEYRENDKGTENKSVELTFPKKIIFKGAEGKNNGKTYDTTYATDNVRTYIEKNGNNYEVIVAFKNKPKFDKVRIGEEGEFIISKNSEAFEFNKKKLGKVAPGRIGKDSGDVIVGDQLKDYVKQIVSNDSDISVSSSDINEGKNKVGVKYTLSLNQNLKNKIDDKADKSELTKLGNKEITFIGDTRGAEKNDIKVKLGEEIEIKAEDHWNYNKTTKAYNTSDPYYETENLSTYYRIKDGKKQILIGMKSKPRFEEVTIGKSTENRISITKDEISLNKKIQDPTNNKNKIDKVVKIEVDNEGSLKLNSKKITGLANGTENSDAVNMQQFKTLESTVTANTSSIANNKKEIDKKLNSDDLDVIGDKKYIKVSGKGKKYTVSFDETQLKNTVNSSDLSKNKSIQDMLSKKANLDATNLGETSVGAWQLKLGNGTVTENNTGLVTGGVVKTYVDSQVKNIDTKLDTKLNKDDLDVTGDNKYIKVSSTGKKYTVSFDETQLKTFVNGSDLTNNTSIKNMLDTKANKDATNLEDTDVTKWQSKLGNGTVTENNTGLVTGGVVKTYVDSQVKNIDTKLDTKLNKDDLDVTGDNKYIKVSSTGKKYTVSFDETQLKNTVNSSDLSKNKSIQDMLSKKANLDATNLDETSVGAWQLKLGNGTVTKDNTGLVTGGVVKTYVDSQVKNIDTKLDTKLNKDADNLSETGKNKLTEQLGTGAIADNNTNLVTGGVVKKYVTDEINEVNTKLSNKLSSEDVNVEGDDYITVNKDVNKPNHYTLVFDKDKIGSDIDLTNNTKLNEKFDKYALLDGGNLDSINLNVWQSKLGNGAVTKDNTGLVTGATVFNYINPIKTKVEQLGTSLNDKLSDITITGDDYITATKGSDKGTYTLAFNKDNLQSLINSKSFDLSKNTTISNINTELNKKANKDATNLEDTDVTKWQSKLGNGAVTKDNAGLVKGSTVYNYINSIKQDLSNKSNTDLTKKLNIDADNLSETGKNKLTEQLGTGAIEDNNTNLVTGGVVKTYVTDEINEVNTKLSSKLSSEDVNVEGDDYITVNKDVNKPNHYTLVFDKDKIGSDIDLTNNTKLNEKFDKYALLDGGNLDSINLNVWQSKLGNGEIKDKNNGLVKGSTVYNYVNTIKQELTNKSSQDLSNKLDTDANNLTDDGVTNLTTKLGTGEVAEGNTNLVTGGKVYSKINDVKKELDNKYTTLNNQVTTNTNDIKTLQTDVEDLKKTKQDITNINTKLDGKLDKADLSITGDDYIKVGKGNKFDYTLSFNKTKLESDLDLSKNTSINNMFTTKLGDINKNLGDLTTNVKNNTDSITTLTGNVNTNTKDIDTLKQGKLNVNADNLTKDGETNLINKLSKDSDISKPNNKLVTDKQVNEHLKNYYNKTEVDAKVSNISNTVVEANKKSDLALGGVANAVAMANLLQANSNAKYKTNISAAYGYYGGANALAVGFSGVSENRMVSYRVSGSVNTKGNIALGAGLGVMLGEFKTDKYPEKGKKISELEEKLKMQENEINILKKKAEKTDILEKQIQELMKLIKK